MRGSVCYVQDGVIILPELVDGVQMYSVFDGHGEGGGLVTQWAIQNLPAYVAQAVTSGRAGELLNRVTDAYRLADDQLETDLSYRTIEDSGTTVWPSLPCLLVCRRLPALVSVCSHGCQADGCRASCLARISSKRVTAAAGLALRMLLHAPCED